MTMKKKNLFAILGGSLLAVCSAGIISAVAFANHLEQAYAPAFDANELAKNEQLLAMTTHARDIERNAIYEECKAIAMASDAVKKLQQENDDLLRLTSLSVDSMQIVCPGFSLWSFDCKRENISNKINQHIERVINDTPIMRDLNKRVDKYAYNTLKLKLAREEYVAWEKLPRKERLRDNWNRRRIQKQNMIAQRYFNLAKAY